MTNETTETKTSTGLRGRDEPVVSVHKYKKISVAILGVGMAAAGSYLNVNGKDAFFLWIGVFFCFIHVI